MDGRGDAPTKRVAAFVAATRYEDVPKEAIQLSKNSILDTLGVTLAGSVEAGARIVAELVRESGGAGTASLVGRGVKSSARNAALANGTAAHLLGFSDLSVIRIVHPSISILPALWALAEEHGGAGRDLILAHVLGVEVACKLASVLNPGFNQKGWHPCSVLGTFGATVAAGKLLGLDAEALANALGIAAMQTSGIKAGMGTMCKAYGAGRAAENGVVAAKLARLGFTGPTDVLEGRDGFFQTFGDGVERFEPLARLGDPYEFVAPGITLKPYPSCTCSHTSIAAVQELRTRYGITAEEVATVECSVSPAVANYLKFPEPRNPLEAKYSLQFCVAAALVDGDVHIGTFSEAKLRDPRIAGLMTRVTMVVSPELAALGYNPEAAPFGATVTIRLRDGRRYTCRRAKGPWEPGTPPSWTDLLGKYRACAGLVLGASSIDESIELIEGLETAPGIGRLMDIARA